MKKTKNHKHPAILELKRIILSFAMLLGIFCLSAQTMPTISTEVNEVWYYIQFKNGKGVIQDMGNNVNLMTKNAVKDRSEQLWKVTGTADNYQITNKLGRSISYTTMYQASSTVTAKFRFVSTTNTTYAPAWILGRVGGSGYINQWGGAGVDKQLGEWTDQADPNQPLEFILPTEMGFKPEKPTPEATITGSAPAPLSKLSLWYRAPATDWMTQALPIGNGQFGGMIFGGIKQEEIQFNDKTLWSGDAKNYGAYQNFGSLIINSVGVTAASNYIRYLDLENSLAGVEYDVDGVHFKREYLTSNPDSAIIIRYTASQAQKLNLEVMLWDAHGKNPVYGTDNASIQGKLTLVSYFAKMQVKNEGGTLTTLPNGGIGIQNADAVTIILAGKTNFSTTNPTYIHDAARVPVDVQNIVSKAASKDYATLKSTHIADYKSLFDRVSLKLNTTSNTVPTNQLITKYATDKDDFLNELYFQYGRYLMISSARGLALPSNLQGIWNNSNTPPWSADIHSNINVQENYWPAEVTNLSELHGTFLDYIYRESQERAQWKQNAKDVGQTKGWTLYTENNIFGWHGGFMHNYVIANAWYAMHIWQHYQYTKDKDYLLNKAYPVMKSCAEFWMERLIQDKGNTTYGFAPDGTWVCPKEYSPEHGPGAEDGVAHAQQLVWDLFNNTLAAMDELGAQVSADAAFKTALQAKFDKLDDGCHTEKDGGKIFLREWKYTPRSVVGDYGHRHISHLVGLYPGNQISPLINDSIFKAAVVALDSRGDFSTGWAMGHRITCWARALDGNRAYRILNNALSLSSGGGGIYSNLFDAHPPFQIDGNFAATAAIAELLVQSHVKGIVQILPALPDAWKMGEVKGLRAVGNFTLDIQWNNGVMTTITITSLSGQTLKLNFPYAKIAAVVNAATNTPVTFTVIDNNTISFPTTVNGQYKITAGPTCEMPVFDPAGGKYTTEQSITITSPTPAAKIYYTLDGSTPTASSTFYTSPITLTKPTTLKAIATKDGMADSKMATADYNLGDYIVNTAPTALLSRTDRHLDVVKFTGNSGGSLNAPVPTATTKKVYHQIDSVGYAIPGEKLTPAMTYTGSWMHGYVYLDYGNDGTFDYTLNTDGTPAATADITSYSYFSGKNSLGSTTADQNPGVNSPAFTIPATTQPGIYRLRYKVDWDNVDAGGDAPSIINNGGGIADVLVNIHKSTSHVKFIKTNGDVLKTDNTTFPESDLPFRTAVDIVLKPDANYKQNGIVIKHGYINGPEFIHGNRQWRIDSIPAAKITDNKFTIPAKYVDGDVEVKAEFIPFSGVSGHYFDPNIKVTVRKGTLNITTLTPATVKISDLTGRSYYSGKISGERKISLNSGVYFVNRQKVFVP